MNKERKFGLIGIAALILLHQPAHAQPEGRVYVGSYDFTIKKPTHWTASPDNGVTARFVPTPLPVNRDIQILVQLRKKCPKDRASREAYDRHDPMHDKCSDSLNAAMKFSVHSFRDLHGTVRGSSLAVSHPRYETVAELLCQPKKDYEYVAYVGTDKLEPYYLVFRLLTGSNPASPPELIAFKKLIGSLIRAAETPGGH